MTHPSLLARAASVAVACSLALALPGSAWAQEPGFGAVGADLSPQARTHVVKALQHFKTRSYGDAESELRRAAFYSPQWRPLHFNLGVLAEAQGKLGTAISEYSQFAPVARPDEALIVEQRIYELDDRRRKIVKAHKRQIGAAVGIMVVGAGMTAGGVTMFALGYKAEKEAKANGMSANKGGLIAGGYLIGLIGAIFFVSSFIPLGLSIKSRRQLEGLALGPTRLKLDGGGGMTLKF